MREGNGSVLQGVRLLHVPDLAFMNSPGPAILADSARRLPMLALRMHWMLHPHPARIRKIAGSAPQAPGYAATGDAKAAVAAAHALPTRERLRLSLVI